MANDIRLRANGVSGQLDTADLAVGTTTMTSAALADLPAVDSSHHAAITLFRRNAAGRVTQQEIVWVTAHTAAATSATIVRAQEGTTAQTWNGVTTPQDYWVHADTAADYPVITATGAPSTGTSYFKGQKAVSQDGHSYICTAVGSPGTWADVTAVSLPLAGGTITETNAAQVPLVVKGAASQSADLQQWQDSGANVLFKVDNSGSLYTLHAIVAGGAAYMNGAISAVPLGAGQSAIVVRGLAGQVADVLQAQDSTTAVVFAISATGGLSFSPATTTTAPGAGGAGALPATPAGYMTVTVNGTARKVAYY